MEEKILSKIISMLNNTKYGTITLVVQDGKVVQLEKSEKIRIR